MHGEILRSRTLCADALHFQCQQWLKCNIYLSKCNNLTLYDLNYIRYEIYKIQNYHMLIKLILAQLPTAQVLADISSTFSFSTILLDRGPLPEIVCRLSATILSHSKSRLQLSSAQLHYTQIQS